MSVDIPLTSDEERVRRLYEAFNARDLAAAIAAMHPDVEWPNGMDGGYVDGHAGVREYWTRQWTMIDPRVEPRRVERDDDGRIVVDVHQVIRDRAGRLVSDQMVRHVYSMERGLITRMEIAKSVPAP